MFFLYMLFSVSSLFILTCECTVARKKVGIEKYVLLFSIIFGCRGIWRGKACGLPAVFFSNSGFAKAVCFVVTGVGFRLRVW